MREAIFACLNEGIDELNTLKSVIELTNDYCYEMENNGNYYDLPTNHKLSLSKERNHYINMLKLASDKITSIIDISENIEEKLSYLE